LDRFLTGANPIYFVDDDSVISINFERNPHIKSVHLTHIHVGAMSGGEIADSKWLVDFLSNVGESKEIKLDVDILDNTVDWSPWEGVDRILTGTNFPSLRRVDVELLLRIGLFDPNWFRACCRDLAASLPLLQARGTLGHVN
jgi:hypothetical protein